MASLPSADNNLFCSIGPLLDDGAPYSGMGMREFRAIQPMVLPNWSGKLHKLPDTIADRPFWKYGSGAHSSEVRRILGSVYLNATTDEGVSVRIRHLIIEGSSQWVIGRNVTRYCDIVHIKNNLLQIPALDGGTQHLSISLVDYDLHSYIPHSVFYNYGKSVQTVDKMTLFCATSVLNGVDGDLSWKDTKHIIDKVHLHVCGHSNFSDMKLLLQRNGIWDECVSKYLSDTIETVSYTHLTLPTIA